ncbi:MAG: hypothetical protein R3247_16950, partial [Rhodothermales bacterium]|nr:hypothetical protein [Rhodothermales bacterium]
MKRTLPPFDVLLPRFGSAFLYAALFLLVVALTTHTAQAQVALDTFDDGDVSNVFTFSETGGGIGVGTTEGQDGAADAALSVGILPAEAGSFAGFGI